MTNTNPTSDFTISQTSEALQPAICHLPTIIEETKAEHEDFSDMMLTPSAAANF
jgi:hypothetical protein